MKQRGLRGGAKKAGLPPGTPVLTGFAGEGPPLLSLFAYDSASVDESRPTALAAVAPPRGKVAWLNVDGLQDTALIEQIGARFGLHSLVLEDILNTNQRAKTEDHGDYLYMALRMLRWDPESQAILGEQVSVILTDSCVISLQERPGDVFDRVRERIRKDQGRVRRMGADYLAYSLLDAVVDEYFVILEHVESRLEALEDELLADPQIGSLERIHGMRKEMVGLRRSVWPLRELIGGLERTESPMVAKETRPYLRDLYDHAVRIFEATESMREIANSLVEMYLSSVNNRMSSVMKVLTMIATIFIPLTFLAGLYGMNFQFMPELHWPWAYPTLLAVMALAAGAMVWLFRRRGWF